jgi:hypothetical protein
VPTVAAATKLVVIVVVVVVVAALLRSGNDGWEQDLLVTLQFSVPSP